MSEYISRLSKDIFHSCGTQVGLGRTKNGSVGPNWRSLLRNSNNQNFSTKFILSRLGAFWNYIIQTKQKIFWKGFAMTRFWLACSRPYSFYYNSTTIFSSTILVQLISVLFHIYFFFFCTVALLCEYIDYIYIIAGVYLKTSVSRVDTWLLLHYVKWCIAFWLCC